MSHMIDMTNARANIAFHGEAPWHSLGYAMNADEPIDAWVVKAGLSHAVESAPVQFNTTTKDRAGAVEFMPGRRMLYRSDNHKPLSVVSSGYNVVQPREVVDFFAGLCDVNGFKMEVAGALSDGKRVWALARTGAGQAVLGADEVVPYVLCATSYDGTMATTVQETYVRVVCNNTIQAAIEEAKNKDAKVRRITIPHREQFNADEVKMDLGLVASNFDHFIAQARKMAGTKLTDAFAVEFLKTLLPRPKVVIVDGKPVPQTPVEESRAYQQIMGLFRGEAIGSGLNGTSGTAWQLLNATTQYVDHIRGKGENTRLQSAWFGDGNAMKNRARDLILATI